MEPPPHSFLQLASSLAETPSSFAEGINPLDPVEITIQIAVILLGLVLSAFFSGSEVAYFSQQNANRFNDRDKKMDAAELRVKKMLDSPRRLLATILIGNTFANIITAVFAAVVTGKIVEYFGLSATVVFTAEILVLTFTIVVLTEITPKILALKNAYSISRKLSGMLNVFFVLLSPLARLVANSTAQLESRLPKGHDHISSEDIKHIAEVGEMQGTLRGDEREIIENVIEFGNTTVKEIMTSRVNMVAISTDSTLEDILSMIRERGISRYPLYENDLDNIKGVIHAKDLLPYLQQPNENIVINWETNARKALFVPTTKKIDDLLKDFQREKTHVAIVVDEYGGTEGLVTLDDILEEIIGEIHDEQSDNEELFTLTELGDYIFDGRVDLDDVAKILDRDLTTDDDEYETLGGLIYHITERIPEQGEVVYFNELELTVEEIENNRLKKIRVSLPSEDNTGPGDSD